MAGVENPVASPMELIHDFIRSKGWSPTSDNVRAALEWQRQNPDTIKGLRADYAPPDPGDVAGRIEGQEGGGKGTGRGLPTPPPPSAPSSLDSMHVRPGETVGETTATTPTSSAQPESRTAPDINLGSAIALGVPVLGGAAYGMHRLVAGGRPVPGGAVPPPPDPGTGYNAEGFDPMQRPAPRYTAEGVVDDLGVPREVNPLASAINRAVEPSAVGPSSQVAPMSPVAPGPGPSQEYIGNARPETSTTLEPPPIPTQPKRKVTIEEIPHPGVRPPVRSPYVPRLLLR